MGESLRDQLLKSGLAKPMPNKPRPHGRRAEPKHAAAKPSAEIDLAKAYAIRAQAEAKERKAAQREAEEQARLKRERKQKLAALLEGKALNKAGDAELVRHFEYGGKIRRLHVDAAQFAALNAGDMGIVQQGGRYLLVSREVAAQVREIDAHHLALLVDPGAAEPDDGVPDDLVW